jgi:small subunit ribosomal protein S15
MLTKRTKQRVIKEAQVHEQDTGSAEVQIAVLSKRIDELATHLKRHRKDQHSRRGLLQMVANRRRHLTYLEKKNPKRYATVAKKIGLAKKA